MNTVKDFPSSVISSLEALFLQFNFRRLLFWIFVISLAITTIISVENTTGYAYFSRMERKVSILKDLNELAQDGITSNQELSPIYHDTVSELETYQIKPLSFSQFLSSLNSLTLNIPEEFGKFISGGLLGFMVAIAGWVDRKKGGEEWSSTFFGGLILGIIFGFIGAAIPIIYNPWINYIGFPLIQTIVILFFSRKT